MILKIYSNKTNKVIFEKSITPEMLTSYGIDINSDDFTELFETEILSDILQDNCIDSDKVYYELK